MLGSRRPAAACGCAEDQRELGLPPEHVMDLGHLVDDLVHGGKGEGHEPGADYGPETAAGSSNARPHVGVFGDGTDPDPFRAELGYEAFQGTQAAAQVEDRFVAAHFFPEGFQEGLYVGNLAHPLAFPSL